MTETNQTTRILPVRPVTRPSSPSSACMVEVYGENLGKRYVLIGGPMVIGRGLESDIRVASDTVSRRHAMIERRDAGWVLTDLDSTNGCWLNDQPVTEALLNNGDLAKIGDTIFKYLEGNHVEQLYFEEIYRTMIYDGLTGVFNRRYLTDFLEREFARAQRYERNLSVIFIDLDDFKSINDTYGHLAGDVVLRAVAQTCSDRIRREEVFGRFGGDEFVVIIPESSNDSVLQFAEILRERVGKLEVEFDNQHITATISIGVSGIDRDMDTYEDLIHRADKGLFEAKRAGRNRVVNV